MKTAVARGPRLGAAVGVVLLGCSLLPAPRSNTIDGPYSSAPNHPWNRVHRALFVRTDAKGHEEGIASLDPLLWWQSTYLEHGPKHAEIVEALDAFLDSKAASLVRDPVRRAVFQRDLWAVFDWLAQESPPENKEAKDVRDGLQRRLARAIGQVALTAEEIRALPDNYARAVAAGKYPADVGDLAGDGPVLPADLLASDGDWVALDAPMDASAYESFVPFHAESFAGRSAFSVQLKLPGGRAKTIEYLEHLTAFESPRVAAPPNVLQGFPPGGIPKPALVLNPETPQLPTGSAIALVRRMLLIDREGRLAASPLVESVQIRFFRSFGVAPRLGQYIETGVSSSALRAQQRVEEFELDRATLFADDAGGLRAIGADERVFETFNTYGFDPFDQPAEDFEKLRTVHMDRCVECHGAPGIFSVQVYTRINSGAGTQLASPAILPTSRLRPARLVDAGEEAIYFKSRRYEWGLLQALIASTAPVRGG